jgi:receptor-type tyrosine-protein phosphatase gamma
VNEIGESAASKESYYMITLREAPSGKPTITAAQNASSTALYLAWQPPHLSTLHGEFLGECTPGNRTLGMLFASEL